ncbi:hypothetical protein HO173_003712 [Letharia columbiana]|uniref:Uncharacterized protein n=1 Tax=Letharia columbiana TaxID=112416 RepID=A0A8H6L795_9LECA|nr:uncharacterized protein HO173_003712 [Letharia columbiana]KAF6238078.1 hypothetical protein HO173_003712 [Letharia columbiana]
MRSSSVFLLAAPLVLSTSADAASIHPPSNLLLTIPDTPNTFPNTSLPSNQTISEPTNTFPPSPYIYPIPNNPTTIITFSAYTSPISELSALECILSATEDVETALEASVRDPDRLVRQHYVRVDAEHASLIVATVDGRLKWVTWGQTLKALTRFLHRWEFVGVGFVVVEGGVRVAVGRLAVR